jgi:hypothetical protein
MIRIYLDWGVISNLKTTQYSSFFDFIKKHKNKLQIPYTPAHFKDLMKSHNPDNEKFVDDLENLDFLSENHLMVWNKDKIDLGIETPKQYYEREKVNDSTPITTLEKLFTDAENEDFGFGNFGKIFKTIYQQKSSEIIINDENREILKKMFPNVTEESNMWDLMKDVMPFSQNLLGDREYFKDFRKSIGDQGLKLEPNSGNWDTETVFKNINDYLKKFDQNLTFRKYCEFAVNSYNKEDATKYDYYTTAYLLLDMIGYKQDKLPKPTDNMMNIYTDAEHSFYSAFCDYFIVLDKNLKTKTKVLFEEFKISTKVLSPDEFMEEIITQFDDHTNIQPLLTDGLRLLKKENIIENKTKSEDLALEADYIVYKLPQYYFNFFNCAVLYLLEDNNMVIEYQKCFYNYSNFFYYSEFEQLITDVCDFFGEPDNGLSDENKESIIYNTSETVLEWRLKEGIIQLKRDPDDSRPLLIFAFKLNLNTP